MPAILPSPLLQLLFLLAFSSSPAISDSEIVLESGYTVSTVLDCNKPLAVAGLPSSAAVNPFSILPRPRSRDLLLLDSSGSAFYSLAIPLSQDGDVRLFSGKGFPGFADGDPTDAMFKNPRSFAIDSKENIYVADRSNYAIRKISRSEAAAKTTQTATIESCDPPETKTKFLHIDRKQFMQFENYVD